MKQVMVLATVFMASIIHAQAFAESSLRCSVNAETQVGSGEYTQNLWFGSISENKSANLVYQEETKTVVAFNDLKTPIKAGDKLIGLTIHEQSVTLFIGVFDANMSYSDSAIAAGSTESPKQGLLAKGLAVFCVQ